MTKCSVCKKEYKTYHVFLCSDLECPAIEFSLREIYYWDERNEGLCKKCRDKIHKDPVKMIRLWLLARCKIEVIRSNMKGGEKIKWTKVLQRIDKIEKKLEKTPEVKALYKKNREEIEKSGGDLLF